MMGNWKNERKSYKRKLNEIKGKKFHLFINTEYPCFYVCVMIM